MLPLDLPRLGAPAESLAFLAGLGLSLGALAMAGAAAFSGRLSSRFHTGTLILPMLGLAALVLLLLVLAQSWWQLIGLRALLGLVAGGLPTLAYAASANLVAQSRRGAVVGMASSAGLVGWAAAPPLVGFLMSVDPRLVFAMDLLLVLTAGVSLLLAGGAPAWRRLSAPARVLPAGSPTASRGELVLSQKP
jgi:MFS family permease